MKEVVAVVPVRTGSQRVKDKNFRPFYQSKSLLQLKIEQLKRSRSFSKIYVSSDSELAQKVAADNDVDFLPRDSYLCSSEVSWSDVIAGVCETVPGSPLVSWVHTTSPLFSSFDQAVKTFKEKSDEYDSLVTVNRYQGFLLSSRGRPINYHFGCWHDYSQDLEPLYEVNGAFFLAEKENFIKWRYVIGVTPFLMEVSKKCSVDIDTEDDFNRAIQLMDQAGS